MAITEIQQKQTCSQRVLLEFHLDPHIGVLRRTSWLKTPKQHLFMSPALTLWQLSCTLAKHGVKTSLLLPKVTLLLSVLDSCLYSTQGTVGSFSMAETTMYYRNCTCTTVLVTYLGLWNCQCINFPSQLYIHYCQSPIFRERSQIQPFHTEN